MSLQELIADAIDTDCDYNTTFSCKKIIQQYEQASDDTKATIDNIFITLCGWSLKTHIRDYKLNT